MNLKQAFIAIIVAGSIATLGQAAGRFGWIGLRSELPFIPETLAQWFFAVIPMHLFTLGIRTFGDAAKWYVLTIATLLWIPLAGALIYGVVLALRRHASPRIWLFAGLVSALAIEGGFSLMRASWTLWAWGTLVPVAFYLYASWITLRLVPGRLRT